MFLDLTSVFPLFVDVSVTAMQTHVMNMMALAAPARTTLKPHPV